MLLKAFVLGGVIIVLALRSKTFGGAGVLFNVLFGGEFGAILGVELALAEEDDLSVTFEFRETDRLLRSSVRDTTELLLLFPIVADGLG
jgi:hypothetical protein